MMLWLDTSGIVCSLSTRLIVYRTLGAVNDCTPCAIIFAAVKGAYDMSLKSFSL